nr:hypothetical protein [Acidovorax sp. SRB_14]
MRYRVDQHSKLPAPILMVPGEKDDMTPTKPCMELADEYAAAGHPVSYKVYPGATHVLDRLNQPWKKYNEGNFNLCSMDVCMPYVSNDRSSWGPAHDKSLGEDVHRRQRVECPHAEVQADLLDPGGEQRQGPRGSRERCADLPEGRQMSRRLILVLAVTMLPTLRPAALLKDLSGGQTGRFEYESIKPPNRQL